MLSRRLMLVVALVACGPRAASVPSGTARAKPGVEVTLYRDHAVVGHRVEIAVPAPATGTPAAPVRIKLRIAAGVEPEDVYLVEKSELVIRETRVVGATASTAEGCDEVSCVLDNYERACCAKFERKPSEWEDAPEPTVGDKLPAAAAAEIELTIGAPRAGTYSVVIGYDTPRLAWDAAYTLITPPSHDRVQLRGAVAIRNATGLVLSDVHLRLVDAAHGPMTQRLAERLAKPTGADPNTTPFAEPRDLGRVTIVEGDTRVELISDTAPRPLRSVLVYDPIGTGLDYQHAQPVQDVNLGVNPAPPTRVLESFEIDRVVATQRLPAGPVRLLERRADGTIGMLGETRLFGPATLAASVDSIAVGTADKVTGKRERRELTIDNDRKRVVEEIEVTIENARDQPIEVVLREHLYRGENWTIAYRSVFDITKEGKQQIAMRVAVPARGKQTVLYVVVYSWDK